MTESNLENSEFEEWLADYEAELRDGAQKRFGLAQEVSDDVAQGSDELTSCAGNGLVSPGE